MAFIKRNFRGIIFTVIIALVFTSTGASNIVAAATPSLVDSDTKSPYDLAEKPLRESLTTIVESENYLEYTYIENGVQYKVEEVIESDGKETNIVSTFYKKNPNNQYVEFKKQFTDLSFENNKIEVLISKDGRTIDKIEANFDEDTSFKLNALDPGDPSIWTYQGTRYVTNYLGNLTKAAIISLLISTIPGVTSKIAGSMAGILYSMGVTNIWYTQHNYLYLVPNRISPQGKKTITYVYMDKNRTVRVPGQSYFVERIIY